MIASYQRLWALFDRRGRLRLAALVALMLVAALIEGFAVASVLPLMTALGSAEFMGAPAEWGRALGLGSRREVLLVLGALFSVAVLLAIVLKALADYAAMAFASTQSARWSRSLLLAHLNEDYDWFLGQHSANLGYGLLGRVQDVVNSSLLPALRLLVNAMAALCIGFVVLRSVPGSVFVVVGVLLVLYGWLFALLRRRLEVIGVERESVAGLRYRLVSDVLGGIKEIKLHGLEAGYDTRVRAPFERFAALQAQRHLLSIMPRYVLEALGFIAVCVVVLVVASDGARLQAVVPLLGLFGFAAFRLLPAVQQIYQNAVSLPMARPALDALHHDLTTGDTGVPRAPAPMALQTAIELEQVRYTYPGADRPAIDGLNLRIEAGSMVALVGRSGAGKSTIADFSMGLLTPQAGALRIDGAALDSDTRRAWQAGCSYVAQQVFLLDDTIGANIAFGLPASQRNMDKVVAAAKAAALHDFIAVLPDGYDTRVGERGVRLSGGQRQRIGIARAWYRDSGYIVLDEATNALDAGTESEVLAALEAIRGTRTILVIAHRLGTVARCDRVLLVDEGRLVADGRYDDLMRENPLFQRFAGAGALEAVS